MKFLYYFSILIVLCCPISALAKMQVNFPNANPLQPMPVNIQPDISHNVNSNDNGNWATPLPIGITEPGGEIQGDTSSQSAKTSNLPSYIWPIIIVGGLLVIFFGIYWWLRS